MQDFVRITSYLLSGSLKTILPTAHLLPLFVRQPPPRGGELALFLRVQALLTRLVGRRGGVKATPPGGTEIVSFRIMYQAYST